MAANDNATTPHKFETSTCVINGGGGGETVTATLVGTVTWSFTGRSYVEARAKGRHQSTPVAVETEDGVVTLTVTGFITSYLGSANVHPYEAMNHTGTAAAWTTTGIGSKKLLELVFTQVGTEDSQASQINTFAYCALDSFAVDPKGEDGLTGFTATFTDLENRPTVS
jgi:hypothetical protein